MPEGRALRNTLRVKDYIKSNCGGAAWCGIAAPPKFGSNNLYPFIK
jgi:hypothetical protein